MKFPPAFSPAPCSTSWRNQPSTKKRASNQRLPLLTLCDRIFSVIFSLEDAMRKALPSLFPNLLGTTSSARVEFYDKFQRVADEYDHDFIGKCGGDLDTTLIFVSVFYRYPDHRVNLMLFRGDTRPVFFPLSRALSFSTYKASSSRITKR